MNRPVILCSLMALFLMGCSSAEKQNLPQYAGSGGMSEWNIDPVAYLYHYDNGFTGSDALGYNEQLQTVWSRLGAAQTCKVTYDKQAMIDRLVLQFGESRVTHELNGIGFHAVQSRKVPRFCNEDRIEQLQRTIRKYQRDQL
ncbi:hypothetical protein [Amphritea balenae]|uniref:Uncharacterized protein n=1 Tax=Amphritea balenae TaxID=452629 RepID=A0A3P1SSC1_9GAMM|nr:hypothetical protein [Amphritea balenae]RRD00021.1 hypothetical protein EHS89_07345 [Amphritea balenae]GGK75917.1 hypothetical protein GCM10007941_27600 [Amphritea balenae]